MMAVHRFVSPLPGSPGESTPTRPGIVIFMKQIRHTFAAIVSMSLIAVGCDPHIEQHINKISKHASSVALHADGIKGVAQTIQGNDEQKSTIIDHADAIKVDATEITAEAGKVSVGVNKIDDKYVELTQKWYVRWGKWLEGFFWVIAIGTPLVLIGLIATRILNPSEAVKLAVAGFKLIFKIATLPLTFFRKSKEVPTDGQ